MVYLIRGRITAVEWAQGEVKPGPMLSATITIQLTRSRRQVDADAAFSQLQKHLGHLATVIVD